MYMFSETARLLQVRSQYEWFLPVFLELSPVQRADVARLLYMHAYGGVYAGAVPPRAPPHSRHARTRPTAYCCSVLGGAGICRAVARTHAPCPCADLDMQLLRPLDPSRRRG